MLAAILSLVQQIYKYITTTVTSQLALIVSQTGGTPASNTIGMVPKVQLVTSTGGPDTGFVNVINFSGVGRLRAVAFSAITQNDFQPGTLCELQITIDGTVLFLSNVAVDGAGNNVLHSTTVGFDVPNSTGLLIFVVGNTRIFLDMYFKSSLLVQQRINQSVGGVSTTVTTTAEYEHS